MNRKNLMQQRLARRTSRSLSNWTEPHAAGPAPKSEASVDCGWGRLIFGHTFDNPAKVTEVLREEAEDQRDIVMYLRDPHVVTAQAPQEVFLDPSHTYRLWMRQYRPARYRPKGFICRRVNNREDIGGTYSVGVFSSASKKCSTIRRTAAACGRWRWTRRPPTRA